MAQVVIMIKNESSAKVWIEKAQAMVDEAEKLMQLVGNILKSVQASSEGSIVDDLVKAGESMLNFANAVAENMKQICATLNQVLDQVIEAIGATASAIARLIGG